MNNRIQKLRRELNVLMMLQHCSANRLGAGATRMRPGAPPAPRKRRATGQMQSRSPARDTSPLPTRDRRPHTKHKVDAATNASWSPRGSVSDEMLQRHQQEQSVDNGKHIRFQLEPVEKASIRLGGSPTHSCLKIGKYNIPSPLQDSRSTMPEGREGDESGPSTVTEDTDDRISCQCKQLIEHAMLQTNKTLDMLQVQAKCSSANVQLLSAGREFLGNTMQLLRVKHAQAQRELNRLTAENGQLRRERDQLSEKLTKQRHLGRKLQQYQREGDALRKDGQHYKDLLDELNREKDDMIRLIGKQGNEVSQLVAENRRLRELMLSERSLSAEYLLYMEEKILKLISLLQVTKQEITVLRQVVARLRTEGCPQIRHHMHQLRSQCTTLNDQIRSIQAQDETKCRKIENELAVFMRKMSKNEESMVSERNYMLEMVERLSNMLVVHKQRISQLLQINRQQEQLLLGQSSLLRRKQAELSAAHEGGRAGKERASQLERQLERLYAALEGVQLAGGGGCPPCCPAGFLQRDLVDTRARLDTQRDSVLVKDKIIQDQQDTIRGLKVELDRTQSSEELVQRLNSEQRVKERLLTDVEELEWQRTLLADEILELQQRQSEEGRSAEVCRRLDEQQRLLGTLEHQLAGKQRDWHQRYRLLAREKTQAIQVARFATHKLIQTIQDFQQQQGEDDVLRTKAAHSS